MEPVEKYRELAQVCRANAKTASTPLLRALHLELASHWDKTADECEKAEAKGNPKLK